MDRGQEPIALQYHDTTVLKTLVPVVFVYIPYGSLETELVFFLLIVSMET